MASPSDSRQQQQRRDPPQRRGGWLRWGLGAAVAAALGLGIYGWMGRGKEKDRDRERGPGTNEASRQRAEGESPAIRVKTVRPHRGGFERTTTQPGVVHYYEYADLYAKASGYLRAQVVDIGDTVTRGQVLAEVYDPERQQRVEQAAAEVEQAKAEVTQAEALIKVARAEVAAEAAEVKERKAEVAQYVALRKFRQKQYVRYVELAVSRAVDERAADEKQYDFESARSGEEVAAAAVERAQGRLDRATAALAKAEADLEVARARQRVAEAGESAARILAEYTDLLSPYDGVVTRRSFHRGAFIRSAADGGGDVPVLSVARTDRMRVIVEVPDRDVPYVDRGDDAVVEIDALPGEVFKGTVCRFSDLEYSANRTMRVEIDLPNPNGRLRHGMYGPTTILLERAPEVLTIPSQALVEKDSRGEGSVFLVKDGRARKARVRVGKDNGMRVEILDGIRADDAVILSYAGSLEDGDPVELPPEADRRGQPGGS